MPSSEAIRQAKEAVHDALVIALGAAEASFGITRLLLQPHLLHESSLSAATGALSNLWSLVTGNADGLACIGVWIGKDTLLQNIPQWVLFESIKRSRQTGGQRPPQVGVGEILNELVTALVSQTIKIRCVWHYPNLSIGPSVPTGEIALVGQLKVVPVDEEIRAFLRLSGDGGPSSMWIRGQACVVMDSEEAIRFGPEEIANQEATEASLFNDTEAFVRAVSLAVGKAPGLDFAVLAPRHFSPMGTLRSTLESTIRPGLDLIVIDNAQLPEILQYFSILRGQLHPAIAQSCSRYVTALLRREHADAILDAAIGLESVLLYQPNSSDRGELRFRFAANYACLKPVSERAVAFQKAQAFYDTRSAIAHGGTPHARTLRTFGRPAALGAAASFGTEMLRQVLIEFAADYQSPAFATAGPGGTSYWTSRLLMLESGHAHFGETTIG